MRKDAQAVITGVARGVDQDIDMLRPDPFGRRFVWNTHQRIKAVGLPAEEFAAAIAVSYGREEREIEAVVVDIFKERLQEHGNRMRTQFCGDEADAQIARRASLHRGGSRGRRGPLGVPQRMLFPLTGQGQFFFRPKVAGERKPVQKTSLNILPLPNGA
jgi:hypothetical protein